ncbi:galactokinase [Ascosphaera aggregata]|nr:galactokinase [Ascosphaera aggregata]
MATIQEPNELVPETQCIADVWATDGSTISQDTQARWRHLISQFKSTYNYLPDFVARSPGRVNIIGEHIDYSLYDVLPTALSVDVLVAIKPEYAKEMNATTTVKLANTSARFAATEFEIPADKDIEIDASTHDWSNYFKAGMRVALAFLKSKQGAEYVPANLQVVLDGNVPPGGGVSSSAAFICSCALAVIKAHGYSMTKQDLQDTSIVSERAVGVFSGGMDQAASIFSRQGYLLYTRFFPTFEVQHVPVPPMDLEVTFLVAQSFITSNKAETGPRHYNLRVAECTLAAVILAHLNGVILPADSTALRYSLRTFHEEFMRKKGCLKEPLEYQLDTIIATASKQLVKEAGYTREEMAEILGIDTGALELQFLSSFPVEAERFKLRQRALHCFKEARRVLEFKACLTRSERLTFKDVEYLGQLLDESQSSCRDLYNCSCDEVNNICAIARRTGALGSRVTGAGWGGATVHMVPVDKIDAVKEALTKEYYRKRFPNITKEKLADALIVSKPSNGSFLIYGEAIAEALN